MSFFRDCLVGTELFPAEPMIAAFRSHHCAVRTNAIEDSRPSVGDKIQSGSGIGVTGFAEHWNRETRFVTGGLISPSSYI